MDIFIKLYYGSAIKIFQFWPWIAGLAPVQVNWCISNLAATVNQDWGVLFQSNFYTFACEVMAIINLRFKFSDITNFKSTNIGDC